MNKLKLLKLAKQGNSEAISILLSRKLSTKEIVVKVFIKQGCLNIILESNTVPNQEIWGKLISKLIDYLGLTFIEQVKISAKKAGEDIIEWSQTFEQLQKNASQTVQEIKNPGENTKENIHKFVEFFTNPPVTFNPFTSKLNPFISTPVLPYGFFAVAFTNQGKTLICSKGDGSIIFWNWLNSKLVKIGADKQQNFVELKCHKKTITAFDVSLNEKFLVTASENEPIKLWDLINRKIICTFGDKLNSVQVIKFSPNSELSASAEADNRIKIWNIKSQLEILNLSSDVNSIRFSLL
ncbi:MAG: hypothetical protein RSE13_06710 [Planktothrix sp. GU0601_MAG3]|nr:MAG: hypothetical protein RSE13_06710 [Planktothrix sp. GU0601_MAG3]